MARINIEDSIYRDKRFINLINKSGSMETALGILVRAWSVAQAWYLSPSRMIPLEEWNKQELSNLLFEVGLATITDNKVHVSGSDTQFEWLLQRSEAGKKGGPAAARSRREIIEKSKRRKSSEHDGSRPLTLTLALPLSPSLTPSQKELKTAEKSAVPSSRFIGVYIKAYQARYGAKARPSLEGKTLGGIKRLLGGVPLERACALIQAYLQIDDPWFKTKAHDFETFAQNLTKIGLALDTGERPEGSRRGIEEILDKEFSRGDRRIQHTDK